MKKFSLFMLVGMLFSSVFLFNGKAEASSFNDINNHWAKKEIEYILEKGFIKGYNDGSFKPNENITRAQAAIMIGRAIGVNGEKPVYTRFEDVDPSVTGSGYIEQLAKQGVLNGYGDVTFRPYQQVNRGDTILLLAKSGLTVYPTKPYPPSPFKDVSVNQVSGASIINAYHNGIVNGYSDGTFRPYNKITRGEFCVFMSRAIQSEGVRPS